MDEPLIPDIDPIQVDTNGVVELLKSLEVHKAAGPDEIPAQLLKEPVTFLPHHLLSFTKHQYISAHYLQIGKEHNIISYPSLKRAVVLLLITTDPYP